MDALADLPPDAPLGAGDQRRPRVPDAPAGSSAAHPRHPRPRLRRRWRRGADAGPRRPDARGWTCPTWIPAEGSGPDHRARFPGRVPAPARQVRHLRRRPGGPAARTAPYSGQRALPDTEADRRAWHLALASFGPDDVASSALARAGRSARAPAQVPTTSHPGRSSARPGWPPKRPGEGRLAVCRGRRRMARRILPIGPWRCLIKRGLTARARRGSDRRDRPPPRSYRRPPRTAHRRAGDPSSRRRAGRAGPPRSGTSRRDARRSGIRILFHAEHDAPYHAPGQPNGAASLAPPAPTGRIAFFTLIVRGMALIFLG